MTARFAALFYARLIQIGLLSLFTLTSGGTILLFVGTNALRGGPERGPVRRNGDLYELKFGSQLDVQAWTAIIGIGAGLVSHGFHATYYHIFDCWSSRQAMGGNRFDYGRYLNSLPRSPVGYGFRGFRGFMTLKHLLNILSIVGSVGYKFGINTFSSNQFFDLDVGLFAAQQPGVQMIIDGIVSPWITDQPTRNNRCFQHALKRDSNGEYNIFEDPPETILMASHLQCIGDYSDFPTGNGTLNTYESVALAKHATEEGEFVMRRNDTGWHRVVSENSLWLISSSGEKEAVVIDYRFTEEQALQVQWARHGNWMTDESSIVSEMVIRRETYTFSYASMTLDRMMTYEGQTDCTFLRGVPLLNSVLSEDEGLFGTPLDQSHLQGFHVSVDALLQSEGVTCLHGVSTIVRAAMAYLSRDDHKLKIFKKGERPDWLRDEVKTREYSPEAYYESYPTWVGFEMGYETGIYYGAACAFTAIGALALFAVIIRIWMGPPVLTSWAGQHIYLAFSGAISLGPGSDALATGSEAAPRNTGTLHIGKRNKTNSQEAPTPPSPKDIEEIPLRQLR